MQNIARIIVTILGLFVVLGIWYVAKNLTGPISADEAELKMERAIEEAE